jgi:hypothetical protein
VSPERLSRRRLNRATLARQLLLERSPMPAVEAVEHLVGMQAQAPLAPYVGLWSRLPAFVASTLGSAVERGDVVRTHTLRGTVHLHSASDAQRLRGLLQPMLAPRFSSTPFARQLQGVDPAEVCRLTRALAHDAALTRPELGHQLRRYFPDVPEEALAYAATYLEPMVQTPPRGVWGRRGAARWQTFDGWFGPDRAEPAVADQVVLRFLAAFGPAGVADVRIWSGMPGAREVVDRLRPRLRSFTDANGRELLDLPEAPRPDDDTAAPVRFLPEYDNVLLSYAHRERVIPDGRAVPLPPGDGARAGTVLVDGDVRATWAVTPSEQETRLTVAATPSLTAAETAEVSEEAEQLLLFVAPGVSRRIVDVVDR